MLDALLKGGVSPFECDPKGNTALHFAVRRGQTAVTTPCLCLVG